jgi:hypothetical protein
MPQPRPFIPFSCPVPQNCCICLHIVSGQVQRRERLPVQGVLRTSPRVDLGTRILGEAQALLAPVRVKMPVRLEEELVYE